MVPIIDGKLYHFGPRGLYNGLILLGDDETRSYWDHIHRGVRSRTDEGKEDGDVLH
jgi:hypothetical protein